MIIRIIRKCTSALKLFHVKQFVAKRSKMFHVKQNSTKISKMFHVKQNIGNNTTNFKIKNIKKMQIRLHLHKCCDIMFDVKI